MSKPLSPAQKRYLAEIRGGHSRYNGRARRTLRILKAKGLISYEYTLVPGAYGHWSESFVAKPTGKATGEEE